MHEVDCQPAPNLDLLLCFVLLLSSSRRLLYQILELVNFHDKSPQEWSSSIVRHAWHQIRYWYTRNRHSHRTVGIRGHHPIFTGDRGKPWVVMRSLSTLLPFLLPLTSATWCTRSSFRRPLSRDRYAAIMPRVPLGVCLNLDGCACAAACWQVAHIA